jgi:hypothetical protein
MTKKTTYPKMLDTLGDNVVRANGPKQFVKSAERILDHLKARDPYPALWEAEGLVTALESWVKENPPKVEELPDEADSLGRVIHVTPSGNTRI